MFIETYSTRFKERFKIFLDEDDYYSFIGVERYLGNIGSEPISYSNLSDIPQPHRHDIEQKILEIRKKHQVK